MPGPNRLLSLYLPEGTGDQENYPEPYRNPSPPPRELPPFGGTQYLPEEFLYQHHGERAQEPESGRAPTPQERAAANGRSKAWEDALADKERRAARPYWSAERNAWNRPDPDSTAADVFRALTLALGGVRGGYVNGAVPGGMPAPMRIPTPSRHDPQPLFFDGEIPQMLISPLGAYSAKTQEYKGELTPRESMADHLDLPDYMRRPADAREGGRQFFELPGLGTRLPNPAEMTTLDVLKLLRTVPALAEGLPMGWTVPATTAATHAGRLPQRGFGLGTHTVEELRKAPGG